MGTSVREVSETPYQATLSALKVLEGYARTAKKHGFRLSSHQNYRDRALDAVTSVRKSVRQLEAEMTRAGEEREFQQLEKMIEKIDISGPPALVLAAAQSATVKLKSDIAVHLDSPRGDAPSPANFLPNEIVPNGVYRRVLEEANLCIANHCFNAGAAMLRRLLESLLIDAFEANHIGDRITVGGEYQELKALIGKAIAETTFKLGRNTKDALPNLKFLGDMSLHSRRNLVRAADLERIHKDVRYAIEELASLSAK